MSSYLSQYSPDVPEEWRDRSCGIAALSMGLLRAGAEVPPLPLLIEEGVRIGAWQEEGGWWVHGKLAILAHNYGIPAYAEEFRSADSSRTEALRAYGLEKLKRHVASGGTVLVSVPKGLAPEGHYHLVLLTAARDDSFVVQDPAYEHAGEGADVTVPEEVFVRLWRGLAVFLG